MKFKEEWLNYYLIGGTQNTDFDEVIFLDKLEKSLANGITAFQYREKEGSQLNNQQKIKLGLKIRALTNQYQVPLFVDDDVDLAIKIKADGVHFGQSDDGLKQRQLASDHQLWIGLSISNLFELEHSNLNGIDYLGCGPVFPTKTKTDAKAPIGIDGLKSIQAQTNLPIVSIGGVNLDSIKELHQAGINNYSFISLIFSSLDIQNIMQQLEEINDD